MGNECKSICKGENDSLHYEASPSFNRIKSVKVQDQFPQHMVPQTVREKVSLLNLNIDPKNSQLWKYQQPTESPSEQLHLIYTLINKDDIKQPLPQSQLEELVISNVHAPEDREIAPKPATLNPYSFSQAAIFVFKSKPQHNQDQSIYLDTNENLIFEEVYYGPVNQKMNVDNAIKIFQNGQNYRGNIQDNKLDGKGCIKNALADHNYDGQWKNNKPEGHGIQSLQGQFRYQGQFQNGKWNGPGKLVLLNSKNPVYLQGNFVNGTLEGSGRVYDRFDQVVYEGEFKNGKQHGRGKWKGPQGDSYEGEFVQGNKQGYGKFVFASGAVYEGNFKDGRPEGQGVLINNGLKTIGRWYKGQNILVSSNQQ